QRGARSRADGGVLLSQQFLRFGRPWHQFAIQEHPVSIELAPEPGGFGGGLQAGEKFLFQTLIVKKATTGAGVADAGALVDDAEPFARGRLVTADDDDGARPHVFLFADDADGARVAVMVEGLRRMFQKSGLE